MWTPGGKVLQEREARPHLFLQPAQHPSIEEEGIKATRGDHLPICPSLSFLLLFSARVVQGWRDSLPSQASPSPTAPLLLNLWPQASIRRMIWAGSTFHIAQPSLLPSTSELSLSLSLSLSFSLSLFPWSRYVSLANPELTM